MLLPAKHCIFYSGQAELIHYENFGKYNVIQLMRLDARGFELKQNQMFDMSQITEPSCWADFT